MMTNLTRREFLAISAASAFAIATPARAEAPATFPVDEIVDDATGLLAECREAWRRRFRKRPAAGVCRTPTFSVKRPLPHS